jgi:hypothetical protein
MRMNTELQQELQTAGNMNDVRRILQKHCRQYGDIRSWQLLNDAKHGRLRCFVELAQRRNHSALAAKLGAQLTGREVCLDIPIPPGLVEEPAA